MRNVLTALACLIVGLLPLYALVQADEPDAPPDPLWISQVIVSQNPQRLFYGSPSIVRLTDGSLLASYDPFGPDAPKDLFGMWYQSGLARSDNNGRSWNLFGDVKGTFWSTLFTQDNDVYLLGCSAKYGHITIRRSSDGGRNWTNPDTDNPVHLFAGGSDKVAPNYHCAPMPMLISNGRIYRAFEDNDPLHWPRGFKSLVISANVNSNLMDTKSWTMSNKLAFDPAWAPEQWKCKAPGWLEGNMVEAPNGEIWNILRFHSDPVVDKAAIVKVSRDGTTVTFDPETGFIDFPGGASKFTIRRDPVTKKYISLVNNNTDPQRFRQRNVLSLSVSDDLIHWNVVKTLLEDDQDLTWERSVALTGFQYVDWQFDGDDIIYLVRTAYDGGHNYHDSNRITFHRLDNFRTYLAPEPSTTALLGAFALLKGGVWITRAGIGRRNLKVARD